PSRRSRAADGAGRRRSPSRPGDTPCVARRGGGPAVAEGVRAARGVHAPAGRGAVAPAAARACVGLRLRQSLQRCRRLRPLPAREGRPPLRSELARDSPRRGLSAPCERRVVSRLPISARLAAVFAVAMAVVLFAAGWFVYARVASDLSHALDQDLR